MRWKAGQVSILSIVMKLFSIVILCWWNFKKPLVHSVTTVNWVKRLFFYSWKCIIIELFCPIESWHLFKETISQKKIKKILNFFSKFIFPKSQYTTKNCKNNIKILTLYFIYLILPTYTHQSQLAQR